MHILSCSCFNMVSFNVQVPPAGDVLYYPAKWWVSVSLLVWKSLLQLWQYITWQALLSGAVTYTVKYSYKPGKVNTPPEGALEVTGIGGTSTILTALERGTTYYIWVVGVSEGGEGPGSDRTSGLTYDSELRNPNCSWIPIRSHKWIVLPYYTHQLFSHLIHSSYLL